VRQLQPPQPPPELDAVLGTLGDRVLEVAARVAPVRRVTRTHHDVEVESAQPHPPQHLVEGELDVPGLQIVDSAVRDACLTRQLAAAESGTLSRFPDEVAAVRRGNRSLTVSPRLGAVSTQSARISDQDLLHLRAAVALAREAYEAGDGPFGTVLVDPEGTVLWSGRNHDGGGDETQHPELAVAQWSVTLSPEVRAASTVYTSGEHCPMCSAAHGWMGLGRIVYAVSSAQLLRWREEWGAPLPPVAALPIQHVVPSLIADGPSPELEEELRARHHAAYERAAHG